MLILTRNLGQSIVIGRDVFVTLLGIRDHQARIGIRAPMNVPVHREEIAIRIAADAGLFGDSSTWNNEGEWNK